jgi:CheY-like chemotaxis protein
MFIAPQALIGKRVLVVEDEFIVALVIEDFLLECGCIIVGPCGKVTGALEVISAEPIDLAILDVNLAGETVYPVAYALAERGIPFLFTSGYGDEAMPAEHPDWKVCAKPFRRDELIAMLLLTLDSGCSEAHILRNDDGFASAATE